MRTVSRPLLSLSSIAVVVVVVAVVVVIVVANRCNVLSLGVVRVDEDIIVLLLLFVLYFTHTQHHLLYTHNIISELTDTNHL